MEFRLALGFIDVPPSPHLLFDTWRRASCLVGVHAGEQAERFAVPNPIAHHAHRDASPARGKIDRIGLCSS